MHFESIFSHCFSMSGCNGMSFDSNNLCTVPQTLRDLSLAERYTVLWMPHPKQHDEGFHCCSGQGISRTLQGTLRIFLKLNIHIKLKLRVFLRGHSVAIVTFYVRK